MRGISAGIMLVIGVSSSAISQTRFENLPVTLDAMPREAVAPIPVSITTDQFRARLRSGGTVQLVGNVLDLGTPAVPNATTRPVSFLAVDVLELRNGAQIVTNGNPLVIFANTLISENGRIIAFPENNRTAPPPAATPEAAGSAGNPGNAGLGGGVVTIHVIDKMEGIIHVNLSGQNGSKGGDGRKGGQPPRAGRGADAQNGAAGVLGVGICGKGGQDGQPGFRGLQGGPAGPGGPGGDGGFFQLINIGPAPLPTSLFTFDGTFGTGAVHGTPGPGGPGGQGGDGGSGSTYCGGGRAGQDGPEGPEGTIPNPPKASDGRPGAATVRNLDLEVMVRAAVTAGGAVALPSRP